MLIQLKNKESDIVNKSKQKNFFFRKQAALLLIGALMAGLLPMGTGMKSWATEQPTLRNPRILKTTQEVAPGSVRKELNLSSIPNWSYAGTVPSDDVSEWDCIWFGNYWQEDTNGDGKADKNDEKTPIKWRVLSVEGDDVFLLADKNLDVQRYNDTDTDVTWETCTMRSWLNGYRAEMNKDGKDYSNNNFLNNAFSLDEQSAIKPTNVVNNDNPEYGTEGGNDTSDKVYLLSIDEVTNLEYGFDSSRDYYAENRTALNTIFVKWRGAWTSQSEEYEGNGYWWLRSPGYNSNLASSVDFSGLDDMFGRSVDDFLIVVRPALHLNLSSASGCQYAGIVNSDGKVEEIEAPAPSVIPSPIEPGNTQKPQETIVPETSSQPGDPSVVPSTQQPDPSATPDPGITSGREKPRSEKYWL